MSGKFDWQSEDDVDWEELPDVEERDQSPRKRRRWPFLLLIVLLAAGAAAAIFRQVNQRVESNNQAMRADIQSSHNLMQIAKNEGDIELFNSVLSGRTSSWTATQSDLFKAELLQDRPSLGLNLQSGRETAVSTGDDALNISFSTDFREAEVVTPLPYSVNIGSGLTETIVLQETSVFRLGRERWLFAPPEEHFWGERDSVTGANLKISFPERDRDLAIQLLPDLERKLGEMCQILIDVTCPPENLIEIQFSTDPSTLMSLSLPEAANLINGELRITLPTPTLVGIPVDEAGYQAIFRGYAAQIVTSLISNYVGYNCCERLPFYQALIDYQLNQLSLKPWPVTAKDYERIRDERMQLADLADFWSSKNPDDLLDEDGWRVYVVADYLMQTGSQNSAIKLQRELLRRGSFYGWLNGSFSSEKESANADLHSDLMRQFWLQAYPQATQAGSGFTVPPPDQDLQLICLTDSEDAANQRVSKLFKYDILQDQWHENYTTSNYLFMKPLPDDDQLILLEVLEERGVWQTGVWRNDQLSPILGNLDEYSVSFGQIDPIGNALTAFVFLPEGQDANITLFNIDNCNEESGCTNQILPGIPLWSPDGSQIVFGDQPNIQLGLLQQDLRTILFDSTASTESFSLYLGDREALFSDENRQFSGDERLSEISELTYIGNGYAPFWLDDETFAYVAEAEGRFERPAQAIVYMQADQESPQELLNTDNLVEAFKDPEPLGRLFWIHYAMVHPTNPDVLFVAAFEIWDQQAHIFSFDLSSKEAKQLMSIGYSTNHTLSISPDGRFLVLTGNNIDDPDRQKENALLQIFDLDSGETIPFLTAAVDFPPFPSYDWSADGRWLAMMLDHDLIGLYAPQEEALHMIKTEYSRCTSPSWVSHSLVD